MSGHHHRAAPAGRVHPVEAGRRMHASIAANDRAGEAIRACAARHDPGLPFNTHAVPLSDAPVGLAEVARLLADLQHYAALVSLPWAAVMKTAGTLYAAERHK